MALELLTQPDIYVDLLSLSAMEVVLGIDSVIFISILALNFLLLIGVMLIADGMGQHIGKGYIHFAMAFSLGAELINMRMRKKLAPVALHHRFEGSRPTATRTVTEPGSTSP